MALPEAQEAHRSGSDWLAQGRWRQEPRPDPGCGDLQIVFAFDERCKIHDLVMKGVGLALRKRGYPAIDEMKAKWQGKRR